MNPFEFFIVLVAILTVGRIIQVRQMGKYGIKDRNPRFGRLAGMTRLGLPGDDEDLLVDDPETVRLREEVKSLKERLQVLERITVDKENSLAREIDDLRDR